MSSGRILTTAILVVVFLATYSLIVAPMHEDTVHSLYMAQQYQRNKALAELRQHFIEPDEISAFQLRGAERR